MHPLDRIRETARNVDKTIVLPEAAEPRMLHAAQGAIRENYATIVLLGNSDEIRDLAAREKADISGATILDHTADADFEAYVNEYFEKRKHKGVDQETAKKVIGDPLFFGAMMVKHGRADGMVAGAVNATANVIRSTLHCIGTDEGIRTLSSCFVMVVPGVDYGHQGSFIYADCGVVPDPDADQLADIAIAAAQSCRSLLGVEPVVAMLAFSTKGSAKHRSLDKIIEATRILKEQRKVKFAVDGELQGDAALIPSIGERKCPGSPVAGKANTLIFPDLNSGNIAYKLTERLAQAEAYGPLLQGAALPVNDLSRGCSAEDIEQTIAITVVQATK